METTTKNRINTYLTDAEKALLAQLAAKHGLGQSAYLRMLLLKAAAEAGLSLTPQNDK